MIGGFYYALTNAARRERTVILALIAYAGLWTLYGVIAKSSQDLHFDMVEQIVWSRELAAGFWKHPPMAAAVVSLWFDVFPVADWSYYLLAMLMPTLALWIFWRLSADYLDVEKRIGGLALLMLIPFFNIHALKFNVNTVLMPLWAITTLWFLRSYKTQSLLYAALAGVGAAACMLGKYWSVFLIAGLILTALIDDSRRKTYFRSAAPWVTALIGSVALGPHIYWLTQHNFEPFGYAISTHGEKPFADAAYRALAYLSGAAAYVAIPVIVALVIIRPTRAMLADIVWPADTERRLVAAAFWGPLLLPVIVAPAIGAELSSVWSMSTWMLLPVVLLSSPSVRLERRAVQAVLSVAVAIPFILLAVAPVIAIYIQRSPSPPSATHSKLLAQRVQQEWRQVTNQPLKFIGGDADLAYGAAAYSPDKPLALPGLPPTDDAQLKRSGVVLVCYERDTVCVFNVTRHAAENTESRTVDAVIRRQFLGYLGRPRRYVIVIVPPQP